MKNTKTALARRAIAPSNEETEIKNVMDRDIPTASGRMRNEYGLTEQQEEFARRVANGSTLSDAYKESYNATTQAQATIYSSASRLIDHPMVAARVKTLLAIKAEKTHALDAMRVRQHVFDRLMIESVKDDSPAAARISALVNLGKIDVVSMFTEQKGLPKADDPKPEEIQAKLEALIRRSFGPGTTISNGPIDEPHEVGEERGSSVTKRDTDHPNDVENIIDDDDAD